MQSKAVGHCQVDIMSVWTIKYTLRVSLKIKHLYGRNQCQVQFNKPFSSLQLNCLMQCILIG